MVFWGSPITARYSVFSQWRNSRFYFFSVQLKSSLRSEQVSKLSNFDIIMHYHPCIYLLTLVLCLAFIKTIEGKPKPSFDKYVIFNDLFRHIKLELSKTEHTDCPATLSTLSEGYYSGVGGPTGQVVVHSGRGRFDIFFKVSWTHLRWWEGVQKSSQKLKNRVFGIFCTPGQMSKSS